MNIFLSQNVSYKSILILITALLISSCGSNNSASPSNPGTNGTSVNTAGDTISSTDIPAEVTNDDVIIIDTSTTEETIVNQAAVISGKDRAFLKEDSTSNGQLRANGNLKITDNDAGEAKFTAASITGNYGRISINTSGYWYYDADNSLDVIQKLNNNDSLTDNLIISSVDGTTHTIVITILGTDETVAINTDLKLSWIAPAEREDNTAISLSEIAGYNIYYGSSQGNYNNSVSIDDGSAQDYTFTGLTAGTYYFVITTRDVDGRESKYSAEIVIVV